MYLPRFAFEKPTSLKEASSLLAEKAVKSALLAGGTDLLPRMKYGVADPERLISLKGLGASAPNVLPEGDLILDGASTLSSVASSPEVAEKAPLLAAAAGRVATREIRNVATLAGNLCQDTRCLYFNQRHTFQFMEPCFKRGGDFCYFIPKGKKCWAVYMSDTAPALVCLGAKIQVEGGGAGALLDLEALYSGDPLHPLTIGSDTIISGIRVPPAGGIRGWAFSKLTSREGMEFGALNIAVLLEADKDPGTCTRARIAVGAVSPAPARALKSEGSLVGEPFAPELLAEAARQVAEEVTVTPHHGYSKWYLTRALEVEALNALTRAVNQLTGGR